MSLARALTLSWSRWKTAALAMVLLKLWLVAGQPLIAFGGAGHDDRLFLELSNHLLKGEWLGPYSQFTLMKGAMYPFWIAGTFLIGLPLPISQHLLYLAACLMVLRALRNQLCAPWQAFAIFTLLWWNPMTYELPVLGRVLRQNIYTPTALLVFAGLITLHTRRDSALKVRIGWGILLGVSSAALWLTREESIWMVPSAILLTAAAAGWGASINVARLRALVAPLSAAVVSCLVIIATVCTLNYQHYGFFGTVEFRAPQFIAAYGALQRVTPDQELRYVPVTRDVREKVYNVSPAFAELRGHLEGQSGVDWAAASSVVTGLPANAREIGGGWFVWALRDAVGTAGHLHSAAEALTFYQRIADEVNAACDDGRLKSAPRRDSLVPRWGQGHWTRLNREWYGYVKFFLLFREFNPHPIASAGDADVLQLFRDLCRWPVSYSPEAPSLERPMQTRFDAGRIAVLDVIGTSFRWLSLSIALGGLVAWCWAAIEAVRRRHLSYVFVLSSSLLGASAAIVAINLLVHIMSFYNRSTGAFAQGYPLLLLGCSLAVLEACRLLRRPKC